MSASASTVQVPRSRSAAHAAAMTGLVAAALVVTFGAGRWSAPEPTSIQPERPAAVFELRHSAPQHRGVVKEGGQSATR
jgi:hypothetical protein